jgi:hypothetical protein
MAVLLDMATREALSGEADMRLLYYRDKIDNPK